MRFAENSVDARTFTTGAADRLWAFVPNRPPEPDVCWEWQGARFIRGYGRVPDAVGVGFGMGAHRAAYALTFRFIPSGWSICHQCGNPSCVRPAHLYVGGPHDNANDLAAQATRAANSAKAAHDPIVHWSVRKHALKFLVGTYRFSRTLRLRVSTKGCWWFTHYTTATGARRVVVLGAFPTTRFVNAAGRDHLYIHGIFHTSIAGNVRAWRRQQYESDVTHAQRREAHMLRAGRNKTRHSPSTPTDLCRHAASTP